MAEKIAFSLIFSAYRMTMMDEQGIEKIVYKSSWVTDLEITSKNIRNTWFEQEDVDGKMKMKYLT